MCQADCAVQGLHIQPPGELWLPEACFRRTAEQAGMGGICAVHPQVDETAGCGHCW
jgi:hypothetical protein